MSDFTQNLTEKIEKSKSRVIQIQEEQDKHLIQTFTQSRENLKKALIEDTKKLQSVMRQAEQELENEIKRYRTYNREQIQEEQKKANGRYNIIIVLLIIILAALLFPIIKNWNEKRIANEWEVPQKYQYSEENGKKYILIPTSDLSFTNDKKSVFIQIEDQGE